MAKVCILRHWGVQLILACGWAGKGRGGMFLFLWFLHFHSCRSFIPVPLFHLLYYLFYLFSSFLWETTQNDPQWLTALTTPPPPPPPNPKQHNQSKIQFLARGFLIFTSVCANSADDELMTFFIFFQDNSFDILFHLPMLYIKKRKISKKMSAEICTQHAIIMKEWVKVKRVHLQARPL